MISPATVQRQAIPVGPQHAIVSQHHQSYRPFHLEQATSEVHESFSGKLFILTELSFATQSIHMATRKIALMQLSHICGPCTAIHRRSWCTRSCTLAMA